MTTDEHLENLRNLIESYFKYKEFTPMRSMTFKEIEEYKEKYGECIAVVGGYLIKQV